MYVLIFVFLLTQGILTPNTTALALNRFRESAGTASAVIGFIQTLCGVLATGLVSLLHNGTALPMTAVMTGFSCLGVSSLVFRKIQDEKEWKAKS